VSTRVAGLTGVTLQEAPGVCHECVWWQSRSGRGIDKQRWIERAETDWGAWGAVYRDDDGTVIGSMQYGPAELFPRAWELPAGPPSVAGAPGRTSTDETSSSPSDLTAVGATLFFGAVDGTRFRAEVTLLAETKTIEG